jgi:cysteine desulfurase
MIYFDNAASMKPRPESLAQFNAVINENYANPAALHKGGIEAEKLITAAKEVILSRLPGQTSKKGRIIFTSGATESNNLALLYSVKKRNKTKIVTTTVEHPSVSAVADRLRADYEVVRVSPLADIAAFVDENTALVSINAVCGETGYIVHNSGLYEQIKAEYPDCLVHADAAQAFMKLPVKADLISISAHKTGGIPGIGALFIKDGVRVNAMLHGGGQQNGVRPGTEPTALISSFMKACEYEHSAKALHDRLIAGLENLFIKVNSMNNISNIVNFSCGVKSEPMLHFLAEQGIMVSSGSACARGKKSEILPVYGVSEKEVDTAIRVSFGWQNTVEEVDRFLEVLEKGLKKWR